MPALEMFCERCGSRQAPEDGVPNRSAGAFARRLLTSVRATTADGVTAPASESYLRLCLNCRGYSCPTCWNEGAGACQTCAPLPEVVALEPPAMAPPALNPVPTPQALPPPVELPVELPVAPAEPQPVAPRPSITFDIPVAPFQAAARPTPYYPTVALPAPRASVDAQSTVRPCRTCLLPLSARAHFCRRCGSSQD